jgi:hypothetical protein
VPASAVARMAMMVMTVPVGLRAGVVYTQSQRARR